MEELHLCAVALCLLLLHPEQVLQVLQIVPSLRLLPLELQLVFLDGKCLLALNAFNLHLEFLAYPLAFEPLLLQLPHQLVPLARQRPLHPLELSLHPPALSLHPQHPLRSLRLTLAQAGTGLLQAPLIVTQFDPLVLDDGVACRQGVSEVRDLELQDRAPLQVLLLEPQVVCRPRGQLLMQEGLRLCSKLADQHVLVRKVRVALVSNALEVSPDALSLLVEGPLGLLKL